MNNKANFFTLILIFLSFNVNAQKKETITQEAKNDVKKIEQDLSNDPLPSWNEGVSKKTIMEFVKSTVTKGNKNFVPIADRIACFDNDGTLWGEQPLYFQFFFAMDRIKALAPQHPEWKTTQPYQALLEGDLKTVMGGGEKSIMEIIMTTHAGISTDDYNKIVKDWMATATDRKTGKHYNEMTYQPMVELLKYLRDNGYKTFIVSGGGVDFMRAWTEKAYGIPPYQVIGSSGKVAYDTTSGKPMLMKLPEINFIDDKAGKPEAIYQYIGKYPVFTAGNSDGDYQMLQYTCTSSTAHFGMIVHHTDAVREYAYDRTSPIGHLEKGLDDAGKYNWLIVDMKTDWKKIYPFDK